MHGGIKKVDTQLIVLLILETLAYPVFSATLNGEDAKLTEAILLSVAEAPYRILLIIGIVDASKDCIEIPKRRDKNAKRKMF